MGGSILNAGVRIERLIKNLNTSESVQWIAFFNSIYCLAYNMV